MVCILRVVLILATVAFVRCSPTVFPIEVPSGLNATNHDSNSLFCVVPAPWFSIMIFYLGNFAAHAATLVTYPGEPPMNVFAAILYALFFPNTGIVRGLNAIFRHAHFSRGDLQAATRAGALCMVVRTGAWRPREKNGSETPVQQQEKSKPNPVWKVIEGAWCKELPRSWPYFDTSLERPKSHNLKILNEKGPGWKRHCARLWEVLTNTERKIQGTCILPENGFYALAYVPRNAKVMSFQKNDGHREDIPVTLSSSYSAVRATIAVVQILYACATLYKATKGPQIEQYGFAAFGLTPSPYLIMSLVNFVGNLVTPNYDSLYIVHSPILQEAIDDYNALIDGMVGALVIKKDPKETVQVEDSMLSRAMTTATPLIQGRKTETREFPLCTNRVSTFSTKTGEYRIFFSCPVIERTDKILQTRVLSERPTKTWGGYFNPENRAEIDIPWYSYLFFTFISLFIGALSLLPIGIISTFHENHSTNGQQAWILCWMFFGVIIGTLGGWWTSVLDFRSRREKGLGKRVKFLGKLLFALVFGVPGIGGFVVVGKMLRDYGDCVNLF